MTAYDPQNLEQKRKENSLPKGFLSSIKSNSLKGINNFVGKSSDEKNEALVQNLFPQSKQMQQQYLQLIQGATITVVNAQELSINNKLISLKNRSKVGRMQAAVQVAEAVGMAHVVAQNVQNYYQTIEQSSLQDGLDQYVDQENMREGMEDEVQQPETRTRIASVKRPKNKPSFSPTKTTKKTLSIAAAILMGSAGIAHHTEKQSEAKKQNGAAAIEEQIKAKVESPGSTKKVEDIVRKQHGG